MQNLMRLFCLAYLIALTFLLLTKDPLRLVGVRTEAPWLLQLCAPLSHLLSFFLLAVLMMSTSWPAPRWLVMLLLMCYAGATELLQNLFPPRTAEWQDWLQDVVGIAAGAALCWIVAMASAPSNHAEPQTAAATKEDWEVVRTVMSRPTSRGRSWWA